MVKPEHGSPYPEDHTLAMALTTSYNHCIGPVSTLSYASPACSDLSQYWDGKCWNKVL